jgi:hypothetical protein
MAHNIWNDNGRDSVFTGRGTPAWHTLGQTIEGCATWREAIDLANLNWTVGKENLYTRDGVELPTYGIFRSTDHAFLGAVGERYQPIQNESAFAFVDALWSASVFSANPAFDACLHYVEHKNFITHAPAKLPGNIRIYKPED